MWRGWPVTLSSRVLGDLPQHLRPDALVVGVGQQHRPGRGPLEFRAVPADRRGDVAGDAVRFAATSMPFSPNGNADTLRDPGFLFGHLFGWTLQGGYAYRDRHSLRDCCRGAPAPRPVAVPHPLPRSRTPGPRPRRSESRCGLRPLRAQQQLPRLQPGRRTRRHPRGFSLLADWPTNNPDDLGPGAMTVTVPTAFKFQQGNLDVTAGGAHGRRRPSG